MKAEVSRPVDPKRNSLEFKLPVSGLFAPHKSDICVSAISGDFIAHGLESVSWGSKAHSRIRLLTSLPGEFTLNISGDGTIILTNTGIAWRVFE